MDTELPDGFYNLIGGPYNTLELTPSEIDYFAKSYPIGVRKFIVMPPMDRFQDVRLGNLSKDDDLGGREIYEYGRFADGTRVLYYRTEEVFEQAILDHKEGRASATAEQPQTGSQYRCFLGEWALSLSDHFAVTDDTGRKWACCAFSREKMEEFDTFTRFIEAELLHKQSGTKEPRSTVWLPSETREDLPAALAEMDVE